MIVGVKTARGETVEQWQLRHQETIGRHQFDIVLRTFSKPFTLVRRMAPEVAMSMVMKEVKTVVRKQAKEGAPEDAQGWVWKDVKELAKRPAFSMGLSEAAERQ
jgi:hypothetical protein